MNVYEKLQCQSVDDDDVCRFFFSFFNFSQFAIIIVYIYLLLSNNEKNDGLLSLEYCKKLI